MADPKFDRVRALFEAALDLPEAERSSFLDRECPDDAETRQQVENLLEADREADGFLEPPSGFALPTAELEDAAARFLPEEEIGGYRLIRELGRGGRGVVYLASDPESGEVVALKVLGAGLLPSAVAVERFRDEIKATDPLAHPGIVKIRKSAEEHGRPFLIMDFIEGHSLADEILLLKHATQGAALPAHLEGRAPALPIDNEARVRAVARLVGQVAEALHHAHQNNVFHRDVKPQNILLDDDGQPHLIDFGLAKVERDLELTQTGAVEGTPNYMSPEQVRAERDAIDGRTDVYSLGIVLYELLTLKRPFDAPTAGQVMHNITATLPQSIRRISPSVPTAIELVCSMAIEKRRRDRYPTAQHFASDLEAASSGAPTIARKPSAWTQARRSIDRRPVPWAAAASVLVTGGLAVGLLGGSSQLREFEASVDLWHAEFAKDDESREPLDLREPGRFAELLADRDGVQEMASWKRWEELRAVGATEIKRQIQSEVDALRPGDGSRTRVELSTFGGDLTGGSLVLPASVSDQLAKHGYSSKNQTEAIDWATAPRLILDFSASGGDELLGVELSPLLEDGLNYGGYQAARTLLLDHHFELEPDAQYRARISSRDGGRFVVDVMPVSRGFARYLRIGPAELPDFEFAQVPGGSFDVESLFPVVPPFLVEGNAVVEQSDFTIMKRPIALGEYLSYLNESGAQEHEWFSDRSDELLASWADKPASWFGCEDAMGLAAWYRMRGPTTPEWRLASSGPELPNFPDQFQVDALRPLLGKRQYGYDLTSPEESDGATEEWYSQVMPSVNRRLAGVDVSPYGLRLTMGGVHEWTSTPTRNASSPETRISSDAPCQLIGLRAQDPSGYYDALRESGDLSSLHLGIPVPTIEGNAQPYIGLRCVAEWSPLP